MMGRDACRRVVGLVPIVVGITFLSFLMMRLAGGDVVTALLENQGVAVTQQVIDARRHELGLDRPFLAQYGDWLLGLLKGDLGVSYVTGKDVVATFAAKLPATLLLACASVTVTVLVAVPLGLVSAARHGRVADSVIRLLSFVGAACPNFLVALVLVYVFAVRLHWLPSVSVGITAKGDVSLAGLVLPTATLGIAMVSKYTRQIRAGVLEEYGAPYVEGARALGATEGEILAHDVLRSIAPMLVTLLALSIGDLLGGAAIVESIFQWDGVGKLAVDSIAMRDLPMVQAYVVWMALIYVFVNLVADLVSHALDPRIDRDGRP